MLGTLATVTMVSCQETVLIGVLIPLPRMELHECLHIHLKGFQLPLEIGFDHAFPKSNNRRMHRTSWNEQSKLMRSETACCRQ
jgi:hypothetical protein